MEEHGNIHATRFAINERVWIVDAELYGRVKEILITTAIDYRVAYFDEDKRRCSEWFTESELRRTEKRTVPQDSP